jgi:hypothetical protein
LARRNPEPETTMIAAMLCLNATVMFLLSNPLVGSASFLAAMLAWRLGDADAE